MGKLVNLKGGHSCGTAEALDTHKRVYITWNNGASESTSPVACVSFRHCKGYYSRDLDLVSCLIASLGHANNMSCDRSSPTSFHNRRGPQADSRASSWCWSMCQTNDPSLSMLGFSDRSRWPPCKFELSRWKYHQILSHDCSRLVPYMHGDTVCDHRLYNCADSYCLGIHDISRNIQGIPEV